MGLSQKYGDHQESVHKDGRSTSPLFIEGLQKAGEIKNSEFSLAMYGQAYDSYIDFGSPVKGRQDCPSTGCFFEEQTLTMFPDFYWSNFIQAVAFGSNDNAFNIYDDYEDNVIAIFDSGSPHIVVPERQFKAFMRQVWFASGKEQYYTREGVTFVDCFMIGTFPKLHFAVDDRWIEVDPYDYIWDVNGVGRTCILMIAQHDYDFFILGTPVLTGYYAYHNLDRSTISFTPLKGLEKKPLERFDSD